LPVNEFYLDGVGIKHFPAVFLTWSYEKAYTHVYVDYAFYFYVCIHGYVNTYTDALARCI